MKHLPLIAVVMLVLFFTIRTDGLAQESNTTPETITSIEGTTWAGKESTGDFVEYTFLKGGHLRYKTSSLTKEFVKFNNIVILKEVPEDERDLWAQNGQIVIIVMKDYCTMVGTLHGDRLEGKAWNVKEKRWTWEYREKQ